MDTSLIRCWLAGGPSRVQERAKPANLLPTPNGTTTLGSVFESGSWPVPSQLPADSNRSGLIHPRAVSRSRQNRKHTEFQGLTPEEVSEIARNPTSPPELRQKAREHEKALRLRNRQRRSQ